MSKNIEIKAKVNLNEIEKKVVLLKNISTPQIIIQEDVFLNHNEGRLKLRKFPNGKCELIFYKRDNLNGPKSSEYYIYNSTNTDELQNFLINSFGLRGIVRKTRKLYLFKNTRIHLDAVESLGEFLELEVIVNDEYDETACRQTAYDLINYLQISEEMLIDKAYIDLLEEN